MWCFFNFTCYCHYALASLCPGPRFPVPKCWGSSTVMPRSKGSPVPPIEIYPVEASWKGLWVQFHGSWRCHEGNSGQRWVQAFRYPCAILWCFFSGVTICKAIQPFEITSLKCAHLVSTWIPTTNARVNNQTAHAAKILHFFKQWPFPNRSLRVGVMMCGWYLCRLPQLLRTYEPYSSNGDTLQHSISICHPSHWDSRSNCTSWIAFLVESENICLIMLSCCWK